MHRAAGLRPRDNYARVVRANPVYVAVSGLTGVGVLVPTRGDDDLLIDNVAVLS